MKKVYHRDPKKWIEENLRRRRANPVPHLVTTAKRRAKLANLEFSITRHDFFLPKLCPLLGIKLVVGNRKVTEQSPTLDRIDNTKGYIPGNVWIISYKANTIKSNASLKELELLVRNLRKAQRKSG